MYVMDHRDLARVVALNSVCLTRLRQSQRISRDLGSSVLRWVFLPFEQKRKSKEMDWPQELVLTLMVGKAPSDSSTIGAATITRVSNRALDCGGFFFF